jgi:hypothetical protein
MIGEPGRTLGSRNPDRDKRTVDGIGIVDERLMSTPGAGICGRRRTASLRYWFAADSSLEGDGFELSVPG